MIQRIQSIYLFLAALFMLAMFATPWASFVDYKIFVCHIQSPEKAQALYSMVPMALLTVLSAVLSVFTIFNYKNRRLQLKINRFQMVLLLVIIAVGAIYYYRIGQVLLTCGKPGFAAIFPVIAFMFVLLANHGIKKDEKLVRSADRIR